ncbi:MAG: isoleucine--tRNA ligase, partial [Candidatus Micrarchaeia archaeon]
GAWRAYFEPYFTYKNYYVESGWWTAKQLHEKGFLTEGKRPIHWCPKCETSLSGYEVSDSYKDVSDPSIFVKFKLKGRKESLLVWTTTPWTLPGNVAVVVHPKETYAKVKLKKTNEVVVLAEKRLKPILEDALKLKSSDYEVLDKIKGSGLDGVEYEPLLDTPQQEEVSKNRKAHKTYLSVVIMANKKYKKHKMKTQEKKDEQRDEYEEFVTMDEGTGAVHTAPGHGQTDSFIGKYYDLPSVSPVDQRGHFTKDAGEVFNVLFVKKAYKKIISALEEQGKLLHSEYKTHRAALCWRCKTQLIFRLSRQWYLKVDPIKEKMVNANEGVSWLPPFGKEKFRNWIAQREDWCVSQQRYWGIPMPIWICPSCQSKEVIGSVEELKEKAVTETLPENFEDLHRHTVDEIKLKCSCGNESKRIRDIFNVWFDSGIAPWASLGYPFKNKELFEEVFPVDLITESQDQIRGWFDSLMFSSMATFNKAPYKAVGLMGWVLDEKGEKMSKSQGNVTWAKDGIQKLGADVIRLYYCFEVPPWEVQKFSFKTATEAQRALGILWNTFAFYDTYASENFEPLEINAEFMKNAKTEDKFIVSRLNTNAKKVTESLEEFAFHDAGRGAISFIVNDFSRWYVKLIRDRTSTTNDKTDRQQALSVMHHVILTTTKLLAPITPFISEELFQRLKKRDSSLTEKSVHYALYPSCDDEVTDPAFENKMETAMKITEAANSARSDAKIKLRWPVREILVSGNQKIKQTVNDLQSVLTKSTNSLKASFVDKKPKGFVEKEFDEGKLFLNPERDEEMVNAAAFREIVRAVQQARKDNGFVVSEKIALTVNAGNVQLINYLKANSEKLQEEVGAKSAAFGKEEGKFTATIKTEKAKVKAAFSKA